MSELKPCPFCGTQPHVGQDIQSQNFCRCDNKSCFIYGSWTTFEKWNARSTGWMPVGEQLPKLGEMVLFYDSVSKRWCKGALQRTGIEGKHQWNSTERFTYHGEKFGDVTHWMMPETPEVE